MFLSFNPTSFNDIIRLWKTLTQSSLQSKLSQEKSQRIV